MRTETWAAFGCEVVVGGDVPAGELEAVCDLFMRRDRTFSRFRPDSELNAVNASTAWHVVVSDEFASMLACALTAARASDGCVDPTLGRALLSAGYDRDFRQIVPVDVPPGPAVGSALHAVRLSGRLLSRPPGVVLDLNGVVKSDTVDKALMLAPSAAFVSAGGDLAARAPVDVALSAGEVVCLRRGGLATSSTERRRWRRAGERRHHLIDPHTGTSARSPWREVTVCARTCLQADVAAKTALLLGLGGPEWLDQHGLPGRLRTESGKTVRSATWPGQLVPETACI